METVTELRMLEKVTLTEVLQTCCRVMGDAELEM